MVGGVIALHITYGCRYSAPKVFKLSELISNGTNIGRKVNEWKPTVGSTHPWCRCLLRYLPDDYDWSNESKTFTPKPYKGKRSEDIYGLVNIRVGKHTF